MRLLPSLFRTERLAPTCSSAGCVLHVYVCLCTGINDVHMNDETSMKLYYVSWLAVLVTFPTDSESIAFNSSNTYPYISLHILQPLSIVHTL